MRKDFAQTDPRISEYVQNTFQPEDEVLKEIRERTQKNNMPLIQVGSMDALHLEVLVRMTGARKAVELGTLAGYSGVIIARAMGKQGRLYTFEYNPKHATVARETFEKHGFADQVELFVGPALEQLKKIESQGPFDVVFIDADKNGYPAYLKWAAEHLRVGGVVIGDNTFAFGHIADEKFDDEDLASKVAALREFNKKAATGGRFKATALPTAEGLTVAVKVK